MIQGVLFESTQMEATCSTYSEVAFKMRWE
jgi:hypothetical protein